MKIHKIKVSENSEYTVFDSEEFEYVEPFEHYMASFTKIFFDLNSYNLKLSNDQFSNLIQFEVLKRFSKNEAEKELLSFQKIEVPVNFISLLSSISKKEQVKLLENQKLSPQVLMSFILKASKEHGYKLSQYSSEFFSSDSFEGDFPEIIELKKDKVIKVGDTSLTDGQLKHAVEFRKRTIANFLDKGDKWHCFFVTYKSLKGKETWQDGKPHYHYISCNFGQSREKVLEQLKSKTYKLNSLPHIEFENFRTKR